MNISITATYCSFFIPPVFNAATKISKSAKKVQEIAKNTFDFLFPLATKRRWIAKKTIILVSVLILIASTGIVSHEIGHRSIKLDEYVYDSSSCKDPNHRSVLCENSAHSYFRIALEISQGVTFLATAIVLCTIVIFCGLLIKRKSNHQNIQPQVIQNTHLLTQIQVEPYTSISQ